MCQCMTLVVYRCRRGDASLFFTAQHGVLGGHIQVMHTSYIDLALALSSVHLDTERREKL